MVWTYVCDVQRHGRGVDKGGEGVVGADIDQSEQDLDDDREHDCTERHLAPFTDVGQVAGERQSPVAGEGPGCSRAAGHETEVRHDDDDEGDADHGVCSGERLRRVVVDLDERISE